jgi:hypothetical protein
MAVEGEHFINQESSVKRAMKREKAQMISKKNLKPLLI